MAKATTNKKKTRRPKSKSGVLSRVRLRSVLYYFFLLSFFLFSVGMVTYVIFFRMVVAAELPATGHEPVVFEEPHLVEEPDLHPGQPGQPGQPDEQMEPAEELGSENSLPKVAIIIDDMGYHQEVGESLIGLPQSLTFSFLPHAPFTADLETLAYRHGKTVMLHLPLEPKDDGIDPGPGALYLHDLKRQERLFLNNLEKVPHATGVNNHMGSRYSESEKEMSDLLQLIKGKNLFFVDSYTTASSLGYKLAQKLSVKSGKRQLFLDNTQEQEEICRQLVQLSEIADKNGTAIGIAHPYVETLKAMQQCLGEIEQDVEFVGVEELLK